MHDSITKKPADAGHIAQQCMRLEEAIKGLAAGCDVLAGRFSSALRPTGPATDVDNSEECDPCPLANSLMVQCQKLEGLGRLLVDMEERCEL